MFRLDSCAHPTVNGAWLDRRPGVTHRALAADLRRHGYSGALAIGLPGVGDYSHEAFWEACSPHPELIPVAALTTAASEQSIQEELLHVRDLGFRIVKVHPRLLGYEQTLTALDAIVSACQGAGIAVALCTYPDYRSSIDPDRARAMMAEALAAHRDVPAIALHAGVLDPEPFARLLPEASGLLLDVSLTLAKYPDDVRAGIAAIANAHPRGVALGSDGPEWSYAQIEAAFADITPMLSDPAVAGIAGEALRQWLASIDEALVDCLPAR